MKSKNKRNTSFFFNFSLLTFLLFCYTNSKENFMGTVYAEITLKNVFDEEKAEEGLIREDEVRSITVKAIVDTGASTIVINEEQRQKLGLATTEERRTTLADGKSVPSWRTKPVAIYWKDRSHACPASVIPGAGKVLLGAIPLEGMDLIIHPRTGELTGAHGDEQLDMAL
jgi:clan AA aspartic protease